MTGSPVKIGTAGWSYPDWEDVVYARGTRNKLSFMAQYFDCIEINSTFYRPCASRSAEKWVRDVEQNPDFLFTAKLWRRFTHETDEAFTAEDVRVYREGVKPLQDAGRLAALLLQFPFFFRDGRSARDRLARISEAFGDYVRVLEVRDASWLEPEALDFIRNQDLNIACLDMPHYRRAFAPEVLVTGPVGYLRLHGRNSDAWFDREAGRDEKYDYLYGDQELAGVVDRLEKIRDRADRITICIWNNHPGGKAALNALQTAHQFSGKKVKVPPMLKRRYPQVREIAKQSGGGGLFDDL